MTVVGKPAATVITSSPGRSASAPRVGEVSAVTASRFADEPEFTRCALRTPSSRAKARSNRRAVAPDAIRSSSAASTRAARSSAVSTAPEVRIGVRPGWNAPSGAVCLS